METVWEGEDWQDYCDALFGQRHAPAGYQRVPDKHAGDLGLEGFSVDGTGCGYQCFASQAEGVRARYESQRDKMTADLRKLGAYRDRLEKLLGEHRIQKWIFVVPVHDSKQLVAHARTKEVELRGNGLPFLADNFTIVVQTEEDFVREKAALDVAGASTVGTVPEAVDAEAIERLRHDEAEQVQTMDRKLAKVADPAAVIDTRERLLRAAVDGGNIREHLRRSHPQTNERVERQVAIERRDVLAERDFGNMHSGTVLDVQRRLEHRLNDKVPGLGDDQSSRLAHSVVARWFMDCPIDFPEAP